MTAAFYAQYKLNGGKPVAYSVPVLYVNKGHRAFGNDGSSE
jgi:hypothetical protein